MGPFFRFASESPGNSHFYLTTRSSRTSTLTMSDVEGDDAPMAAAAAAAAAAAMDIQKAIQEVLKEALIHDGLARGLRETTKALETGHCLYPRRKLRRGELQETYQGPLHGARDPPDHRRRRPEAWRVGRPLQDRQGGRGQEDRKVLLRRHQGLGQAQPGSGVPRGPHQETEGLTLLKEMTPAAAAVLPLIVISFKPKINMVLKSDACSVEPVFFSFVMSTTFTY